MVNLKDEEIMIRFSKGESDALGELFNRYGELLFNFFFRTTFDYDLSNDLLMETFERVCRYKKSFDVTKKFRPWLYSIAHNLTNDHFRKMQKSKTDRLSAQKVDIPTNMDNDRNERMKLLYKALGELSVDERRLINLYYLMETPYKEIANLEKASVNSIRIRICRTLKKLNEILKDSAIRD